MIVQDDVVRSRPELRHIDRGVCRARDHERFALHVVERHAHERPQIPSADANFQIRPFIKSRRRNPGELRRRRPEQQIRSVRDRDDEEEDDGRKGVDHVDAAGDPTTIVDYRHVGCTSKMTVPPSVAVGSSAKPRRTIHLIRSQAPMALSHTMYGSASPRCRTSVPMLPLVKATVTATVKLKNFW